MLRSDAIRARHVILTSEREMFIGTVETSPCRAALPRVFGRTPQPAAR